MSTIGRVACAWVIGSPAALHRSIASLARMSSGYRGSNAVPSDKRDTHARLGPSGHTCGAVVGERLRVCRAPRRRRASGRLRRGRERRERRCRWGRPDADSQLGSSPATSWRPIRNASYRIMATTAAVASDLARWTKTIQCHGGGDCGEASCGHCAAVPGPCCGLCRCRRTCARSAGDHSGRASAAAVRQCAASHTRPNLSGMYSRFPRLN